MKPRRHFSWIVQFRIHRSVIAKELNDVASELAWMGKYIKAQMQQVTSLSNDGPELETTFYEWKLGIANSLLEELVQTKFSCSLHRVACKGGRPSANKASQTAFPHCDAEASGNALVLSRICLHVTCSKRSYKQIAL